MTYRKHLLLVDGRRGLVGSILKPQTLTGSMGVIILVMLQNKISHLQLKIFAMC